MNKGLIIAALLATSGPVSAQGFSFNLNGEHFSVGVPGRCQSISCVSVWSSRRGQMNGPAQAQTRRPVRRQVTAAPVQPKRPPVEQAAKVRAPVVAPPQNRYEPNPYEAPAPDYAVAPPAASEAPRPVETTATAQPTKTPTWKQQNEARQAPPPPAPAEVETSAPGPATPEQAPTRAAETIKPVGPVDAPNTEAPREVAKPLTEPKKIEANTNEAEQPKPAAEVPARTETKDDTAASNGARVPLTADEEAKVAAAISDNGADAATNGQVTSPIGVWATEIDGERVHIVPCGRDLCGYGIDPQTKTDSAQLLVKMKPAGARKWSGRVTDARSGGSYSSMILMKEPDILHVQGCAFKGFMCDGQIWRRVS